MNDICIAAFWALSALITLLFAAFMHELGHGLAAAAFGELITFRFDWGRLWKIPVPRLLWKMPILPPEQQRCIAAAGFGLEFLIVPIMLYLGIYIYIFITFAHLLLYPFYAGDASDFRFF